MRAYVDSSAAAKLVINEPESDPMAQFANRDDVEMVSCVLLETELRRVATRAGQSQSKVTKVLESIEVFSLEDGDFRAAGLMAGATLRSLDALHLTAALFTKAEIVVTYDNRMTDAATTLLGMQVVQPRRLTDQD
ncbi:MAG: type II toxin-antitoxin system VapC family toxin [Micrococcales bacterium]|nr:type II toxin-antitoxin system VapC family toxin [Micrococcales bacterium]